MMITETIQRDRLEMYNSMSFAKLKSIMKSNDEKKKRVESSNLAPAIALLYYIHEKEEADGE